MGCRLVVPCVAVNYSDLLTYELFLSSSYFSSSVSSSLMASKDMKPSLNSMSSASSLFFFSWPIASPTALGTMSVSQSHFQRLRNLRHLSPFSVLINVNNI